MAVPWMDARDGMRVFLVKETLHFRAKTRNAVEVRGHFVGVDSLLPPSGRMRIELRLSCKHL